MTAQTYRQKLHYRSLWSQQCPGLPWSVCQISHPIHSQGVALISTYHPQSQQLGFASLMHPLSHVFQKRSSFKQPLPLCSSAFPGAGHLLHHHRCDGHWVSFMCTPALLCPSEPPSLMATPSPACQPCPGPLQRETMTWEGEKEVDYVGCCFQLRRQKHEHPVIWNRNPGREQSKGKKRSKGIETWVPIYAKQMTSSQSASDPAPVADSLTGEGKHILKRTLSSPFKNKQTKSINTIISSLYIYTFESLSSKDSSAHMQTEQH